MMAEFDREFEDSISIVCSTSNARVIDTNLTDDECKYLIGIGQ